MTKTGDTQQEIDAYLNRLRRCLRGLGPEEIREIVEEMRSHILDKASANGEVNAAGVDAALAALGRPEELASEYVTDAMMARAEVSRSPVGILKSLFRWGSLSVAGFFVLLVSIIGYGTGISFFLVGLLKPLHPDTAGLWVWRASGDVTYSVRLGFGAAPAGARELLGWTITPIGLSLGFGLVMLTTHFALWCVRHYRRSRAWR
ncbi:MAG: DUF1700 domain-containing protein [Terriglobales bacterium]|jgi:hypothetical protein